MVSVYPTPTPGQDFNYMGDPMKTGLLGLHSGTTNGAGIHGNSNTGLVVPDDHNKKTRKPYTITKSRESRSMISFLKLFNCSTVIGKILKHLLGRRLLSRYISMHRNTF